MKFRQSNSNSAPLFRARICGFVRAAFRHTPID